MRSAFPIEKVYLYGSAAVGELHEGSDIDLIIVGNFKGRMFERIAAVMGLTDLPIEPLVYTPDEIRKSKASSSFLRSALRSAKRIHP